MKAFPNRFTEEERDGGETTVDHYKGTKGKSTLRL
jgi:hypothetical protein